MSRSLDDFEQSLGQAEALITRERRYKDPPTDASRTMVLGLRGGATVLMVATFERFLRDMTAEHLARLVTRPPVVPFDELPAKLQTTSIWASLDHAMRGRLDSADRGRMSRIPRVRRAATLIVEGNIDALALSETGGNPGSQTVKDIFAGIGIKDVFSHIRDSFEASWGRPETHDFVPTKLDEIVNSRHRVAHRADALSISRNQLGEWPRFLTVLAPELDALLSKHVAGLIAGASQPHP